MYLIEDYWELLYRKEGFGGGSLDDTGAMYCTDGKPVLGKSVSAIPLNIGGKNVNCHTRRGVTFCTFRANAQNYGYAPDSKTFNEMPMDFWTKYTRDVHFAKYPGMKKLANNYPIIAIDLIDSGFLKGVERNAKMFGNIIGIPSNYNNVAENLYNYIKLNNINENDLHIKITKIRWENLKLQGNYEKNKNGWRNRINAINQLVGTSYRIK